MQFEFTLLSEMHAPEWELFSLCPCMFLKLQPYRTDRSSNIYAIIYGILSLCSYHFSENVNI